MEYSLNGTVYQASNIFTGLAPGAYTVYVKDANNCFNTVAVNITNIPRVQVSAYSIAASCGNSDGSIVATATLGTTHLHSVLTESLSKQWYIYRACCRVLYSIYKR